MKLVYKKERVIHVKESLWFYLIKNSTGVYCFTRFIGQKSYKVKKIKSFLPCDICLNFSKDHGSLYTYNLKESGFLKEKFIVINVCDKFRGNIVIK